VLVTTVLDISAMLATTTALTRPAVRVCGGVAIERLMVTLMLTLTGLAVPLRMAVAMTALVTLVIKTTVMMTTVMTTVTRMATVVTSIATMVVTPITMIVSVALLSVPALVLGGFAAVGPLVLHRFRYLLLPASLHGPFLFLT